MRILAGLVIAALLGGCGAGGAPVCESIDRLEALDESLSDGAFSQALEDNDLDAMSEEIDALTAEATAVRESLEGSEGETSELLIAAASGYVAGLNLLDLTMSRDTIREDDLDAALQDVTSARDDLGQARRAAEECATD